MRLLVLTISVRVRLRFFDGVFSIAEVYRNRGCGDYVNATPGFKAETYFVTLISLLLRVDEIVYIHENFEQPVSISSIPISIDVNGLKQLLQVFDRKDRVHINAVTSILHEKFLEYKDRGLVVVESEYVRLRPWIKGSQYGQSYG